MNASCHKCGIHVYMGWLWLVGSIKLYVSFAKEPYKRDDILQKRPIISSILLTVATPYARKNAEYIMCMCIIHMCYTHTPCAHTQYICVVCIKNKKMCYVYYTHVSYTHTMWSTYTHTLTSAHAHTHTHTHTR